MKRERDIRDEAITRLTLDLEQCQRSEAVLKKEIETKTALLETSRENFQRQIGNARVSYFTYGNITFNPFSVFFLLSVELVYTSCLFLLDWKSKYDLFLNGNFVSVSFLG